METHHLETLRCARYHTLGDAARCCEVWYLLHGYGQSAADFLRACEPLLCNGRLLVAPEGLSRFYLRGGAGPVAASWMTSEDRALEIADYVRYLDTLAERLPRASDQRHACVVGFSQGAATAWRWVATGHTHVDRLLAWGGGIPPDLDLGERKARLRRMRVQLVRGAHDRVHTEEAFSADVKRLADHGIGIDCHVFEGDHRVDGPELRHLADH